MGQSVLGFVSLLVAGLAVDCSSAERDSEATPRQGVTTMAAQRDKVKTETKEAAQAVADYSYSQKAESVAKMKGDLADIQTELDKVTAEVNRSTGTANAEAKVQLAAVRDKWSEAKKQLARVESGTESNWNDVTAGFKASHGELTDSLDKMRHWLSDKIEP